MFGYAGDDDGDDEVECEPPPRPQWIGRAQSSRLLHAQQRFDDHEELSASFLRIGLELPGGSRVSNLGRRMGRGRFASVEEEPTAPVFFEHGGGGASAGGGRVSMQPGFWLWPLPESGAIAVCCEWPVVEIPLSSIELDVEPLVDAKARWSHSGRRRLDLTVPRA